MNDATSIERQLRSANERLASAGKALSRKWQGGEQDEYDAAFQDVLRLERLLASLKDEEYAETIPFPAKWDSGAPMPHLVVNDHRALLAFLLSDPDPHWDGSYVTVKSANSAVPEPLGLVEFEFCISSKLGAPNDEVFHGHPLSERGLEAYTAQRVVNSRWIREIEAINSVHRMYRPEHWKDLNHYVFWFHDSTFECVARSFKVETYRTSMKELLSLMIERLVR